MTIEIDYPTVLSKTICLHVVFRGSLSLSFDIFKMLSSISNAYMFCIFLSDNFFVKSTDFQNTEKCSACSKLIYLQAISIN